MVNRKFLSASGLLIPLCFLLWSGLLAPISRAKPSVVTEKDARCVSGPTQWTQSSPYNGCWLNELQICDGHCAYGTIYSRVCKAERGSTCTRIHGSIFVSGYTTDCAVRWARTCACNTRWQPTYGWVEADTC